MFIKDPFSSRPSVTKTFADIDPNFQLPENVPADMRFHDACQVPFDVYGVAPNRAGVLCRLSESMLPSCSEGVQRLAYHLAGACVRFTTDAAQLAVLWTLLETGNMPHFAASGQSGLELFEESDAGIRQIKSIIPAMDQGHGCKMQQSSLVPLPGGLRHYALYLPLYNGVTQLLIGLPEGAALQTGRVPKIDRPIVFYGSSITQGGCAGKVGSCYSNILCRRLDAAQINLGFSGNGRGEPLMAEYIASLSMSAFVLDYDHNAPTPEHLAQTHEPFYWIIREAQPELPILLVSRPDYDKFPEDSAIRRDIIRQTYEKALAAGDANVYFIDGETLFGESDRDLCTVDGTHPTDLGFLRMADHLEPVLRKALHLC